MITDRVNRKAIGQFLTPAGTASFMASLFDVDESYILLDPGAGSGMLSNAFIEAVAARTISGTVVAVESDYAILYLLRQSLEQSNIEADISCEVICKDFIEYASVLIKHRETPFTHVIMNPPYRKISMESGERKALSDIGIETVNLYSAFVMMSLKLLKPGGELVAIIPRSFCNGPYYRSMRQQITDTASIEHIHYIESRKAAFADDGVLQENIIIKLKKSPQTPVINVTYSNDAYYHDLELTKHPKDEIIYQLKSETVFRIPQHAYQHASSLGSSRLSDTGVSVSTGPVVDFRVKEHLRQTPERGTCPLIYATHLQNGQVIWPVPQSKKPNALVVEPMTARWTYPTGTYVVVKRFSSKEERKRIVATLVEPTDFDGYKHLAFENHLNVFHGGRVGLDHDLAKGLTAYLNTTAVDTYFREISGHTQVNATDLRNLPFPNTMTLQAIGKSIKSLVGMTQDEIDRVVAKVMRQNR